MKDCPRPFYRSLVCSVPSDNSLSPCSGPYCSAIRRRHLSSGDHSSRSTLSAVTTPYSLARVPKSLWLKLCHRSFRSADKIGMPTTQVVSLWGLDKHDIILRVGAFVSLQKMQDPSEEFADNRRYGPLDSLSPTIPPVSLSSQRNGERSL